MDTLIDIFSDVYWQVGSTIPRNLPNQGGDSLRSLPTFTFPIHTLVLYFPADKYLSTYIKRVYTFPDYLTLKDIYTIIDEFYFEPISNSDLETYFSYINLYESPSNARILIRNLNSIQDPVRLDLMDEVTTFNGFLPKYDGLAVNMISD